MSPGFQPFLLPLAAPLSSPPTPLPPPARPPLPSTTSVSRGAHLSGGRSGCRHTGGRRGSRCLPSGRAERGGVPRRRLGSPLGAVGRLGRVSAGRGGLFLFCSAAADADADAAVRETEPSMGPQPLKRVHCSCGGSARPSFENGGLHSASGCALTVSR